MTEGTESTFDAWINPLNLVELDIPELRETVTMDDLLEFLVTPGTPVCERDLIDRYREILEAPNEQLVAPPAEAKVLEKLVWPLRHAKGSYMLGNYLGTIALCGLVAEMLAILLYETSDVTLSDAPTSVGLEKQIFGSPFEKLSQERRVSVLEGLGLLFPGMADDFGHVRLARRKYLHLYSQPHETIAQDAVSAYRAAVRLTRRVIGQQVRDGKFLLRPGMVRYLTARGHLRAVTSDQPLTDDVETDE